MLSLYLGPSKMNITKTIDFNLCSVLYLSRGSWYYRLPFSHMVPDFRLIEHGLVDVQNPTIAGFILLFFCILLLFCFFFVLLFFVILFFLFFFAVSSLSNNSCMILVWPALLPSGSLWALSNMSVMCLGSSSLTAQNFVLRTWLLFCSLPDLFVKFV